MLPRIAATSRIVLELLRSGRSMYGLEMVRASEGKLKRGTIYVTLGRLVEKGWLTSEKQATGNSRKYTITGEGRRILNFAEHAEAVWREGESHDGLPA